MAAATATTSTIIIFLILIIFDAVQSAEYLGKFLGKLSELHHGVSGEVYAIDGRTLHIKDFTYDGEGPAAYFYASNSRTASSSGFKIRDENGNDLVLRRYRKEPVTITLPEGKSLNNIKLFYVWCEEYEVNFGEVRIPRGFDYPRPQKLDALRGIHGVSSDNIVIVDAQTLLIPNFSYDGEAPDAKFWAGSGSKPTPRGIRIPDENGKEQPLRRYDRKTIVLTLPGQLTIFDIGHFGVWCEAFTVDFGHIQIPNNPNVPPSLKMLGISPQRRPRVFDIPTNEVRSPQATRQLVGGHPDATTYRPQFRFPVAQHRNDLLVAAAPQYQQGVVVLPQAQAQAYVPQYRQPVPYTPLYGGLQQQQQHRRALDDFGRLQNRFAFGSGGYVPFG